MSAQGVPKNGELRWNIKQSFRDYVSELPDGTEEWVSELGGVDGADLVFDAVQLISGDTDDAGFVLEFGGGVRFQGYGGMLNVDLRDPWIEVESSGRNAVLTANVTPGGTPVRRVPIVSAEGAPAMNGERWEWAPQSARLSVAGAAVLGSVYAPGSDADGFTIRVVGA